MNRTIYIDNLEAGQKERFADADIEVLTPNEVLSESLEETDALIVLCELNIEKDDKKVKRTAFYGVKLVQELRREKFMGKVLFVSFLGRKQLTDHNATNNIINTVGHSLVQLPKKPNELAFQINSGQNLTPLALNDIVLNYCGNHSIINGIKHDISSKRLPTEEYRNRLIKCIKRIASLYDSIKEGVVVTQFETDYPNLDETNISKATDFVVSFSNRVISDNPENDDKEITVSKPYDNWKMILLDDEVRLEDILIKNLESNGISVLLANTVDEAEEYWMEDNKLNHPKIMVVLVDYRLNELKEGVVVHQKKQGYDFLKQVSATGRLIKTIVLSSMQKAFLLKSFNEYDISCEIIPKSVIDLQTENGSNYISEEVIRLGNVNWSRIQNLPDNSSWKYLRPSYIQIVLSNRSDSIEEIICDGANKWIKNYLEGRNNDDISITTSSYNPKTNGENLTHLNLEKLIFSNYKKATDSFINHPGSINDKLSNADVKKIKQSKSAIIEVFNQIRETMGNNFNEIESGIKQSNGYLESNIDKVIPQFIGRRIAIWLAHKEEKGILEIANLLKNKQTYSVQAAKQIVNTGLAISTEDIRNSITLEERKWCITYQYEYFSEWELDTQKEEILVFRMLATLKTKLSDYINKSTYIRDHLSNNEVYGNWNKTNYKILYVNNEVQAQNFKELKACINAINNLLTEKDSSNYEIDLYNFIQLIKLLMKEIKDVSIAEIKSMRSFLIKLCNPDFEQESYKDRRYSSFKTTENRLNEYIRRFEPWKYFKKKYADTEEYFSVIQQYANSASKNEIPATCNSESSFFDSKFLKEKNGVTLIEFYFMPYYYIWQVAKDPQYKNYSNNEIIYWGISLWKEYRKEYFNFKKVVKKSDLTDLDKANIEAGKKYDSFDYQEEIDYYDDKIFSNIDNSIDIDTLDL